MVLKRQFLKGLKDKSVSFCNPLTGEMIHSDGSKEQFKVEKKIGLTLLATFLDNCTSDRLFIVCKLTDTDRVWYEVERYSKWLGDGIFAKRSYTFKLGKRTIELRATSESYFPVCLDVMEAYKSYQVLREMYTRYTHMPLLSSPSTTALILLEANLPYQLQLEPLEEKYDNLIREYSTQQRQEILTTPDMEMIEDFYYLDGRWMYAACLDYEMPVGNPIYDTMSTYIKYVPGWYRVIAKVPENWCHIGLIPVKRNKVWIWPNTPNETMSTWISEPELRVAVEHGWNVKIIERLLFAKDRPFRTWRKLLVDMRNEASTLEDKAVRKNVMDAYRGMMLAGIGRLYSKEWRREKKLTIDEYREQYNDLPIASRLNAIRSGDIMIVPITDSLNEKERKYQHPYLAAYVWAYCRKLLTEQMLKIPFEDILGDRLDAIYTKRNPNIIDTGKIGQFRLKGELHQTMKAPLTFDDLHNLSRLSEQEY